MPDTKLSGADKAEELAREIAAWHNLDDYDIGRIAALLRPHLESERCLKDDIR